MHGNRLPIVGAVGLLAIALSGCGGPAPASASAVARTPVSVTESSQPSPETPTTVPATMASTRRSGQPSIATPPLSSNAPAPPSSPPASAVASSASPESSTAPSAPSSPASQGNSDTLIGDLHTPGTLVACTNFPNPPMATYDATGKPVGVNVEIDTELARRLGLTATIQDLPFAQLIDAVVNGGCDISVSSQNILASRLARIDMIPYTQGVLHLIVRVAETSVVTLLDACSRTVAVQTGSTYADYIDGTVDYAGRGLDQLCAAANRPPVDLREYADPQVAISALASGAVDIYIGNDLITSEQPTVFRQAAALPPVVQGIGVSKAHRALRAALEAAFAAMVADGTYQSILHRYGADLLSIARAH